ncbi:MAG: hypothetical protein KC461_02430, partial [Dehalococcoidia bacterium]|nr:hypothetical protein [Dehalococcoidia bacterium]
MSSDAHRSPDQPDPAGEPSPVDDAAPDPYATDPVAGEDMPPPPEPVPVTPWYEVLWPWGLSGVR